MRQAEVSTGFGGGISADAAVPAASLRGAAMRIGGCGGGGVGNLAAAG